MAGDTGFYKFDVRAERFTQYRPAVLTGGPPRVVAPAGATYFLFMPDGRKALGGDGRPVVVMLDSGKGEEVL